MVCINNMKHCVCSLQGVPKIKQIDTTIEKDSIAQDGTECCVFKGTYRKTPAAFKLFLCQNTAEKEAQLIALTHHENIITLFGICRSRGHGVFIVTGNNILLIFHNICTFCSSNRTC